MGNMSLETETELKDHFNHQIIQLRKDLELRVTEIS